MGCLKLSYCSDATLPKVMYGESVLSEKSAQIWIIVDPLSDKYPSLSPYNYCANNPIRITDPNGMEWEIDGIKYTPDAQCPEGVEQKTQDKWNTMNKTYSTKNGKKVIDEMNKEGVMYNVSSDSHPDCPDGTGSYQSNGDGSGGTIYLNDNNSSVGGLSHEMFHGYQDLNSQDASIQSEIEARMFSTSVCDQAGVPYSPQLKPGEGNIHEVFDYNAGKLQSEYSDMRMNYLINTFNNFYSGYDKLPLKTSNQKNLIKNFYPL